MQPLSPRVRTFYLSTFVVIFSVILPFVILYANGWRLSEYGFYKTGGVFVSVPYPDANVTIGGKQVGRSGYFDRSFYVGNLVPDAYVVSVEREGYLPWNRVVVVEPQLVTDTQALLFPKRIETTRLVQAGMATTSATVIPAAEYRAYVAAFATTTTTSTVQDESEGVSLIVRGGDVFVRWDKKDELSPPYFCGRPTFCVREFPVERGAEEALRARFFRGGVVYATREGGIYFAEADIRPSQLTANIFSTAGADMRVVNDALIIKSGDVLYRVNL